MKPPSGRGACYICPTRDVSFSGYRLQLSLSASRLSKDNNFFRAACQNMPKRQDILLEIAVFQANVREILMQGQKLVGGHAPMQINRILLSPVD